MHFLQFSYEEGFDMQFDLRDRRNNAKSSRLQKGSASCAAGHLGGCTMRPPHAAAHEGAKP